jgi:hypothetical protein
MSMEHKMSYWEISSRSRKTLGFDDDYIDLSDVETSALEDELAKRKTEIVHIEECAEILYDAIYEADEDGNRHIADSKSHKVKGPAKIIILKQHGIK